MQNASHALIVSLSQPALAACAAGGRISTGSGSALQIFDKGGDAEKDASLVRKVLKSGHRTILEHASATIAFENVSALTEQFLIESRLASFTVKSRRYADFSGEGFYVPASLGGRALEIYKAAASGLFARYSALTEMGVPREDARFVLPYAFHSNLYMSVNARSLLRLIQSMTAGRGARWAELRELGAELAGQFEELFPGILAQEAPRQRPCAETPLPSAIADAHTSAPVVSLLSSPRDAETLLRSALTFAGRFGEDELVSLLRDDRPRELEALSYSFRIEGASLACVTHFARHRMQSPIFSPVAQALSDGGHLVPKSVQENPAALELYENAFAETAKAARALLSEGVDMAELSYLAMSGNTVPMLISMNARELAHFMRLRCCERAQWEIRRLAGDMLRLLQKDFPPLFNLYGPSCAMDGVCPEGRLSCGRPKRAASLFE